MTSESADPAPAGLAVARPQQLYRVLAWVGIIAGVVFIVGAVFASGFLLAGGQPWHRGPAAGPVGGCPMMQGGGMKGGMAPGGMVPGARTWPDIRGGDQTGPPPPR